MSAGDLRDRLQFQKRGNVDDGFGTTTATGPFATVFTAAARLRPLRGSEQVMASRLTGVQPYVCTVRASSQSRQITTAWQAVDARSGAVYQIKSPPADPDGKNVWLDMLVQTGTAA